MRRFLFRLLSLAILVVAGYVSIRFYPYIFAKTISGEIVMVKYVSHAALQMHDEVRALASSTDKGGSSASSTPESATAEVEAPAMGVDVVTPGENFLFPESRAEPPADEPGRIGDSIKATVREEPSLWRKAKNLLLTWWREDSKEADSPGAAAQPSQGEERTSNQEKAKKARSLFAKQPDLRENLSEFDRDAHGHFLVAIRHEDGKIYTANTLDMSWQVANVGMCAETKLFPYPPWNFELSGTYYGARLINLYDCPQEGVYQGVSR